MHIKEETLLSGSNGLHSKSIRFSFHIDSVWVDIDIIITIVTSHFNFPIDVYTLEKKYVVALDKFLADCQRAKPARQS